MKSVRLMSFGVDYPQLEKDPSILKSGKKRFSDFKNKISVSMLSSIPVYELEKSLEKDIRRSRQILKEMRIQQKKFAAMDGKKLEINSPQPATRYNKKDYSYFNENMKDVYPKERYASVGRHMRMGSYAVSMLK